MHKYYLTSELLITRLTGYLSDMEHLDISPDFTQLAIRICSQFIQII
jgi:hypothetical protein